jgi:hypothetical protein
MTEYSLKLTNILGQQVYSSRAETEIVKFDLTKYNLKGIYFMQLLNDKGIVISERKIIFE